MNRADSSATAITDLVEVGLNTLHALLTIRAEINLAAGLLNQAAIELETSRLPPLYERFLGSGSQIENLIEQLPSSDDKQVLRESVVNISGYVSSILVK